MQRKRVDGDAGWILHHRPYRDTSRIIDILSHEHGRLSLVSRGSRAGKSKLKGVLRPFMPLRLSWVIRSDLGTLTGAELDGAPVSLQGDALLSGYYLNELLLHMLHRHDPQQEIYLAYSRAIGSLAGAKDVAPILRGFEIDLLSLLGYALNLDHDTSRNQALEPDAVYEYRVEQGPVAVEARDGPMIFSGAVLSAIDRREFGDRDVVTSAGRLLRNVIAFHLDGRELNSRKVMKEMKRAGSAPRQS